MSVVPKKQKDISSAFHVCRIVLTSPLYLLLSLLYSLILLIIFIIPGNYLIFADFALFGSDPILMRVETFVELLPLFNITTYGTITGILMYITALVVGANLSLVTYYVKNSQPGLRRSAGSSFGTVLALIGSTCASCSPVFLTTLLSLLGLGGSLAILPLGGGEFLLLGLVLSILSIYWIAIELRSSLL